MSAAGQHYQSVLRSQSGLQQVCMNINYYISIEKEALKKLRHQVVVDRNNHSGLDDWSRY